MADVRRAIRELWAISGVVEGDVVAVALSGGADSLALTAAAIFEGKRAGISIVAITVNHNLQAGSDVVAERAKQTAIDLGVDLAEVISVSVPKSSLGMEAAARNARYEALDAFAKKVNAKYTMLGHTLDDQAETVLLGLARGSGAKSIAGMSAVSSDGKYLRPLLSIRRETTVSFCVDSGLEFWSDPQNEDLKFSRVKVRKSVIPVLEKELGPGIAEALARTAGLLQEDISYLDAQAKDVFQALAKLTANSVFFEAADVAVLPKAIGSRVIHRALLLLGAEPSKSSIDSVYELVTDWHGQKPLTLPSVRVERKNNQIVLKSTKTLKPGAC
jgi:tRNA(Ile)-lysidine synthase